MGTEFVNRYKVDFKEGFYVIKNKCGSVVYDQGFKTERAAKEEIFARGFEAYLKEVVNSN